MNQTVHITPRLGAVSKEIGQNAINHRFRMSDTAVKAVAIIEGADIGVDASFSARYDADTLAQVNAARRDCGDAGARFVLQARNADRHRMLNMARKVALVMLEARHLEDTSATVH